MFAWFGFVLRVIGCVVLCGLAVTPETAYAYIDPAAGQNLFRILFPILIGIGGSLIFLRRQVSMVFKAIFDRLHGMVTKPRN